MYPNNDAFMYMLAREMACMGLLNWHKDDIHIALVATKPTDTEKYFTDLKGVLGTAPLTGRYTSTESYWNFADNATIIATVSGTVIRYVVYSLTADRPTLLISLPRFLDDSEETEEGKNYTINFDYLNQNSRRGTRRGLFIL